jgi:two-component system CheB/CheR fusion protein
MPRKLLLNLILCVTLLAAGIFTSVSIFWLTEETEALFILSLSFYVLGFFSLIFFFYQAKKKYSVASLVDELHKKIQPNSSFLLASEAVQTKMQEWQFNKKIFDFTPAIIAVFNINTGQYEYVNKSSEEILGYAPSEILQGGFPFMISLLHPEDRDSILEKNSRAVECANNEFPDYNDNAIVEFEYRVRHKNGEHKWLHTYGIIYSRTEDHVVNQILNISIDVTERKRAEEKLKQTKEELLVLNNDLEQKIKERTIEVKRQQEEFRTILMDAPYMISIRRGPDLKLEFINTVYYNYVGRNDIGKPFEDTSQGFKKHKIYETVWQVYNTGKTFSGNALYAPFDKYKTGELVDCWFDFTFVPVYDANGNIDGVATFGFEVTDLIKANKEIKQNEDRFRYLANTIPQKVWTASPEGNINYVNDVLIDYMKGSPEDLKTWGWQMIVHPDDLPGTLKIWANALEAGENFEIENRLMNVKDEYRWHLTRARAQKNEKGEVTLWFGSSTDIDDQKMIQQALKTSEDYFRQVADQTPFMIWKVDAEGLCNYVNKKWIDYTGLSFEESIGIDWNMALHPDDREKEYQKFLACFQKRIPYHSKFRVRNVLGHYCWFLAQGNPLIADEFSGYIGSLTDITEQELAQQATNSLLQKKDEFLSIASHELKTPISSMKAYLQIAGRLSNSKEFVQLNPIIQKANNQVNKLTSLVHDLLDVTKIQAGKMEFSPNVFSITDAIHDCIDQMQNNSNNHKVIVESSSSIKVNADKYRVEQVILNLLENAIKYSPDAKDVLLNCDEENGWLKLSVTDFGIGIPEDQKQFVFDRFFRAHTSAHNFSGLGLGLYISSEIIKRHGGEIGVESKEGKGSVFWFTLPSLEQNKQ